MKAELIDQKELRMKPNVKLVQSFLDGWHTYQTKAS